MSLFSSGICAWKISGLQEGLRVLCQSCLLSFSSYVTVIVCVLNLNQNSMLSVRTDVNQTVGESGFSLPALLLP